MLNTFQLRSLSESAAAWQWTLRHVKRLQSRSLSESQAEASTTEDRVLRIQACTEPLCAPVRRGDPSYVIQGETPVQMRSSKNLQCSWCRDCLVVFYSPGEECQGLTDGGRVRSGNVLPFCCALTRLQVP